MLGSPNPLEQPMRSNQIQPKRVYALFAHTTQLFPKWKELPKTFEWLFPKWKQPLTKESK